MGSCNDVMAKIEATYVVPCLVVLLTFIVFHDVTPEVACMCDDFAGDVY